MRIESIVRKLYKEINGRNRSDSVEILEELLCENVEEFTQNENFFNLPIANILSVISRIDFNLLDKNSDNLNIIRDIISNTVKSHYDEKETLLLLYSINTETIPMSHEDILSLLELFTNCPKISQLCALYKKNVQFPIQDYEFEIETLKKQVEDLKQRERFHYFEPLTEKPKDFEPNIFLASESGKLTSVQWLIENENVDKNIMCTTFAMHNMPPIFFAVKSDSYIVVKYLIEQQKVDIEIRDKFQSITLLHYACQWGAISVVQYLVSRGADLNPRDLRGNTPMHYAASWARANIVVYLLSLGANKNIRNHRGQTPYDVARNNCIKRLLR